jgi:hypothetical protein
MLIREFSEGNDNVKKLAALTDFLAGRAADQNSKKEISKAAFINAAKSIGVNISEQTLAELVSQEPLKNILEPIEPNSDVIRYKGNEEVNTAMSVDQSQDIVDRNAKAAMRRGMNK